MPTSILIGESEGKVTMNIKTAILNLTLVAIIALFTVTAYADTQMYFIRHADVDLSTKAKPLTEAGRQRAQTLVQAMDGKSLTHILVTDYPRTRDTAEPISKDRNLEVRVIPYKGKKAIDPVVSALKDIPDGSGVLIVANSGNLFEIMSEIGVETNDSMPCNSKKCFETNIHF